MKPILYTGLFLVLLFLSCSKAYMKGSVKYSGKVINACTGLPIANTQLTFWIDYASYGGAGPGYGYYQFGQCNTDNNGNFSFNGSYDLSQANSQYGVYGINYYIIQQGGSTPYNTYLGENIAIPYNFMNISSKSKSNIVLSVSPKISTVTFVNTKGIVSNDTLQPANANQELYIWVYAFYMNDGWQATPTKPYTVGNWSYANDTSIISNGDFLPNLVQYTAMYYRKIGSRDSLYKYNFSVNCNNTPISLP